MTHIYSADSVLSEALRQQYLFAMEIQPWYDPIDKRGAEPTQVNQSIAPAQPTAQNSSANLPQISKKISREITHLVDLNREIAACQRCELHSMCKQAVYGEGNETAACLILIDSPVMDNQNEHALFSVENKSMLLAMLKAIGLLLSDVFISSLVKCSAMPQRAPRSSEVKCCEKHLATQINLIKPSVILVLGETAGQQLLVSQKTLPDLRLRHHQYLGIPVVASYHPSELLKSPGTKRKVWADLLQIRKHLNLG